MRFKFILMILISFFVISKSSAQDIIVQSINCNLDFNHQPNFPIRIEQFKITLSDSWFGRDKVHHFLTSALLSGVGYYFFRDEQNYSNKFSQQGGCCFSLSLGLIKEIRDGFKPQNAFSVKDLAADILGTLVGIAIVVDR